MRFPSKERLRALKEKYPTGTRVELVRMDDCQAPPIGTRGTVRGVDDAGSILVAWDNGSGLNVIYGEDLCRKLTPVKTICYGKTDEWEDISDAKKHFLEALMQTEGSEKERYSNVYGKLECGMAVCSDE